MSHSDGSKMTTWEFQRILSAIDLGPLSTDVLRWTALLGTVFDSQIEVFHAYWFDYPPYITESSAEGILKNFEVQRRAVETELKTLAERHLGPKKGWSIKVAEGHATSAVQARLNEESADLLVIGSHGRSGIARLLLGSVAENLIGSVTVPILVARSWRKHESEPAIRDILVPVNFTPHSERAVELATHLASKYRARLLIVHAVEELGSREEAVRHLCEWVPSSSREKCEVKEVVREGNAAEQVVLTAREEAVDLVVLSAEHRPFLELTALGTTAERVVRHSPCSTLVLPLFS